MFQRVMAFSAAYVMALCAAAASAAPVYSFVFGQTSHLTTPGGRVDVPVYWQETVGSGETSVLDAASVIGMFGQGVQVRWDTPLTPTQPAKVLDVADIAYNTGFTGDIRQASVTDSYAQLSETMSLDSLDTLYGSEVSPGVWRQLIGTFSFTAGSVPGEVPHLSAARYVGPLGTESYIVDGNIGVYDSLTFDASATITVVPEPESSVLGLVGILCVIGYVRRRGR
jgi:hypothetical protein